MQKAFNVSETITFTTQVGASNKGEARKRFIEYMGEFMPDIEAEYGFVLKESSNGIQVKEVTQPCEYQESVDYQHSLKESI